MEKLLIFALLLLSSCAELPPKNADNICAIFQEKPDWYEDTQQAAQRWGVAVPTLMAIMHQESHFVADAKPPRVWLLGFIPWGRVSSAYGYAQALDATWDDYQHSAGSWFADRDEFADAVDFIGWYSRVCHERAGIALHDVKNLYLAYYQGIAGYRLARSSELQKTATQVAQRAKLFQNQLSLCPQRV